MEDTMKHEKMKCKTHRVGAVTAGVTLVAYGVLFLLHLVIGTLDYSFIFRLWPLILIGLGAEILLSAFGAEDKKFVYDKGAVLLLLITALFATCMAGMDTVMQYAGAHGIPQEIAGIISRW